MGGVFGLLIIWSKHEVVPDVRMDGCILSGSFLSGKKNTGVLYSSETSLRSQTLQLHLQLHYITALNKQLLNRQDRYMFMGFLVYILDISWCEVSVLSVGAGRTACVSWKTCSLFRWGNSTPSAQRLTNATTASLLQRCGLLESFLRFFFDIWFWRLQVKRNTSLNHK